MRVKHAIFAQFNAVSHNRERSHARPWPDTRALFDCPYVMVPDQYTNRPPHTGVSRSAHAIFYLK